MLFGVIWSCFGSPKTLIPYSTSSKNWPWSVPVSELYSSSSSEASLSASRRLLERFWDAFWISFGDFDGSASLGNLIFFWLWSCSSDFGLSDGRQGCFLKAFGVTFGCLELHFSTPSAALRTYFGPSLAALHTLHILHFWHHLSQLHISTRSFLHRLRISAILPE